MWINSEWTDWSKGSKWSANLTGMVEKNDVFAVVGPTEDQMDYGTNSIEWYIAVIGPTAYQIDLTDLKVIVI